MGEPADDMLVPSTSELLHETTEPRVRPLAWFLASLGGLIAFVGVVIWLFFIILDATINGEPSERRTAAATAETVQPPLLQVLSRAEIDAVRARDEKALHTTAWIDRERGLVRVPIETAMDVVAKTGLPKWPPPAAEPAGSAARPTENQ